jgi:hypothetical protein
MAEGVIAVSEAPVPPAVDQNLRSALEELSNLSLPTSSMARPSVIPSAPAPRKNAIRSSASETEPHRDSLRIVPLSAGTQSSLLQPDPNAPQDSEEELRQLAKMAPVEMLAPLIVPELIDSETSDDQFADDQHMQYTDQDASQNVTVVAESDDRQAGLVMALQELADQNSATDPTTKNSLTSMSSRQSSSIGWLIGSALAIVAAFAVGIVVGRISDTAPYQKIPAESSNTPQPEHTEAIVAKESFPEGNITGRVMYVDGAGIEQPDSGALVLLVPSENTAGLKLDARPLRALEASDAKLAVEAAIGVLKGSVSRAAEDGTFTTERRDSGPMKLVVISRHASRPDSEPVESAATKTIAEWFESPSQLTGRLQVQETSLPAAKTTNDVPVQVTFRKP